MKIRENPVTRDGQRVACLDVAALHHLIWELVDNSVDEVMAGHGDRVIVTLNSDGSVWGTGNVTSSPGAGATSPIRLLQLSNITAVASGSSADFATCIAIMRPIRFECAILTATRAIRLSVELSTSRTPSPKSA